MCEIPYLWPCHVSTCLYPNQGCPILYRLYCGKVHSGGGGRDKDVFLHINLAEKKKAKSSKEAHQNFMCSCLGNPYWPFRVIFPEALSEIPSLASVLLVIISFVQVNCNLLISQPWYNWHVRSDNSWLWGLPCALQEAWWHPWPPSTRCRYHGPVVSKNLVLDVERGTTCSPPSRLRPLHSSEKSGWGFWLIGLRPKLSLETPEAAYLALNPSNAFASYKWVNYFITLCLSFLVSKIGIMLVRAYFIGLL